MNIRSIEEILEPFANAPVECDGMTRIIHSLLAIDKIKHHTYSGYITYEGKSVYHWWIDKDGYRIDYRARMWLGNGIRIPHGIFRPIDYPYVEYNGVVIDIPVLNPAMFKILVDQPILTEEL